MNENASEKEEQEQEKAEQEEKERNDLIQLFTKPVNEMSDEELDTTLATMSKMRKTKIAARKKVDYVTDVILPQLDPAMAEKILKRLEGGAKKAEAAKDE